MNIQRFHNLVLTIRESIVKSKVYDQIQSNIKLNLKTNIVSRTYIFILKNRFLKLIK